MEDMSPEDEEEMRKNLTEAYVAVRREAAEPSWRVAVASSRAAAASAPGTRRTFVEAVAPVVNSMLHSAASMKAFFESDPAGEAFARSWVNSRLKANGDGSTAVDGSLLHTDVVDGFLAAAAASADPPLPRARSGRNKEKRDYAIACLEPAGVYKSERRTPGSCAGDVTRKMYAVLETSPEQIQAQKQMKKWSSHRMFQRVSGSFVAWADTHQ